MEDDFDIRTLPAHIVSVTKPLKRLEKLRAKREKEHYEAVENMKSKKKEINIAIDDDIKNKSEELIKKLEVAKMEIEEFIGEWKDKMDLENIYEGAINPYDLVNKIRTKNLALIDEFHECLKTIEKQRSDQFKSIMKETYQKLIKISHLLPFEAEEFLEKELIDINQITLNNFQHYVELEKELKLHVEDNNKQWINNFIEIEEKILQLFETDSFHKFGQFKRSMGSQLLIKAASSKDFLAKLEEIKSAYSLLLGFGSTESLLPIDESQVQKWLENVQNTLYRLDQSSKNIVEWYKSAIIFIFNRYFDKLEELKKQLKKNEIIDMTKVEKFETEIYTPALEDLNIKIQKDFERIHEVWNQNIQKIEDDTETTYKFLKGSCHLWDHHFERLKQAQLLVRTDVNLTAEKHNLLNMQLEGYVFSIQTDKIRQASTMKKLNQIYDNVVQLKKSLEKSYHKQYQEEHQVALKYKTMVNEEFDILELELKHFLTLNPPDSEKDPKKQKRRASQISTVEKDPDEELIPLQMLYEVFQADATKNWMFGLWESINQYVATGREEVLNIADQWVAQQDEKLKKRLDLKVQLLTPRYLRIKYCIYEKRREELEEHAEKLNCQKLAIGKEIQKLKELQGQATENYQKMINKFEDSRSVIVNKTSNANCLTEVQHSILQLENTYKQHLKEMEICNQNYTNCGNEFFEKLKTSNILYLKSARLFSENGNFTPEELKSLKTHLAKLEKTVQKQLKDIQSKATASFKNQQDLLKRSRDEIMPILHAQISQLKYAEYKEKKWKELQDRLEKEMATIRISKLNIQKNINKFIKESVNNLNSPTYLEDFGEQFDLCFEKAQEFIQNPGYTITEKSTPEKDSSTHPSLPSPEAVDFMSTVQSILGAFTNDMKIKTKEFRTKHYQTPKSSSSTYNDSYMVDILQKITCFQLQCEKFLLDEKQEFLNNLQELEDFRNTYLETFEQNSYEVNVNNCKIVFKKIMQELKLKEEDVNTELKEMHEKIKVLYGHPNNNILLLKLEDDFNEFLHYSEEKIVACFEPYKIKLTTAYQDTKRIIEKVRDDLKILSTNKKLSKLLQEIDEHSSKSEQNLSKCDTTTYLETSTELTGDWSKTTKKSYNSVEEFCNELDFHLDENIEQIKKFIETNLLQKIRNFKATWADEIKQILKLYKVKYDQITSVSMICE